jgi:hypothetical protein
MALLDLKRVVEEAARTTHRAELEAFQQPIDVVVVREGKNLKGHVLGFVLRTVGNLEKAFVNSVKAIETRNISDDHLPRREKVYA